MRNKAYNLFLLGTVALAFLAVTTFTAAAAGGPDKIDWEKPGSMVDRITTQGQVEVIPESYDDYGVKLSGKKGMLTGYKLPQGWKEAVKGVEKLVCSNSGGLKHDPATVLNAKIFEKLTGIHLEIIEMKDALLWPKSLSVAMARSDDVDIFYSTRSMLEIPHLSAAGWIENLDVLWPESVQGLYPKRLLETIKGKGDSFYGSPFCLWAMHLFYRPSWLKAAGVEVPKTWQELIAASKKVDDWVKENKGIGYSGMVHASADVDQLHQLWSMTTYSQGEDKRIIHDGKVVIDPEAWKMLCAQWTRGGMSKQSIEYFWSSAPEVFAKGKAGFIITGGVYMKNFANPDFGTGIQDDWGVALTPGWEGAGRQGFALAGNDGWMINNAISENKLAAAMLWLDYQRSYQAQFNELYVEGNESVMESVYAHPAVEAEVSRPDLRKKTVTSMIGESYPPGMMEILELFKEFLHKVALGQMDADTALEQLSSEINSIQ